MLMEDWEKRLIEEVEAAAAKSSARQLSDKMGLGVNYVSQLLAGKTRVKLPTLVKVLGALGPSSTAYVLTGSRPDATTAAIVDTVSGIQDPEMKRAVLDHVRNLRSVSNPPAPSRDPEG